MISFVYFVVGAGIAWFFAYLFYKKGSKGFNKLSDELKTAIINSPKETPLTVKDLNAIIDKRVVDETMESNELPYKACPKCGSENLARGEDVLVDYDADGFSMTGTPYPTIECLDCGWEKTAIDEGSDWNR